MATQLLLVKLGGSIITRKSGRATVRPTVLRRLIEELAAVWRTEVKTGRVNLILAHGQGSFAHLPAAKYQTKQGFIRSDSDYGMAVTQDSAAQLNRLVVAECLRAKLPAVTAAASNYVVTHHSRLKTWLPGLLTTYLDQGLLPVTYGDVLVDTAQGCAIWSADTILRVLAEHYARAAAYQRVLVVHVGEVKGVLDSDEQVIGQITPQSFANIKKHIGGANATDVTGGMLHKVEESLQLTKLGIETRIVSGVQPDNMRAALTDSDWLGTSIVQ